MNIVLKIRILFFLSFIFIGGVFGMENVKDSIESTTSKMSDLSPKSLKASNENEQNLSIQGTGQNSFISQVPLISSQPTMEDIPPIGAVNATERKVNEIAQLNNETIDFMPLIRALRMTKQASHLLETFNFLVHYYLTSTDVYVAEMAALSLRKQEEIFDWVTSGWKGAQWVVGTSQNIATLLIGASGIAANFFKDKAVALATASAIVAGCGTLLSLVYDYCCKKRLHRIARNLVIMAIQAAKEEEQRNGFE